MQLTLDLESRLYKVSKENNELRGELRRVQKLIHDLLSLRTTVSEARERSRQHHMTTGGAMAGLRSEREFLRGQASGLTARCQDLARQVRIAPGRVVLQQCVGIAQESLRALVALHHNSEQPLVHKAIGASDIEEAPDAKALADLALRQALEDIKHDAAQLREQLRHTEQTIAAHEREMANRDVIIKSMAAQLQVRDEHIRRLQASANEPATLNETMQTRDLEEALVSLQDQVVNLSEELEALRHELDD